MFTVLTLIFSAKLCLRGHALWIGSVLDSKAPFYGRQAGQNFSCSPDLNLLLYAEATRYSLRDRVIVLLSVKAGLRAAEIANLTWDMVLDPNGSVGTSLELRNCASRRAWSDNFSSRRSSRGALSTSRHIRASVARRAFGARQQGEIAQHRHLV